LPVFLVFEEAVLIARVKVLLETCAEGVACLLQQKFFRRWHRRVNVAQKRYAVVSALAASGVPALVLARGHLIDQMAEIPFVLNDKVESLTKTKEAVALMKRVNLWDDVEKVYKSKRYRAGKGKRRNRRYKQKLGPVIVYNNNGGIIRAFRNIPGVTLLNVSRINLLKVAPGGHLGRLIIWTESAFRKLDSIFGTGTRKSDVKSGFIFPSAKMTNSDFSRLIRSEEIVKCIRTAKKQMPSRKVHGNPLKKPKLMVKLNPYSTALRRKAVLASAKGQQPHKVE